MKIVHTTIADIPMVEEIYSEARAYQQQLTGYSWPVFSRSFIEQEIKETRHYKVVDEEGRIAGVFSIVFAEPVIWNDQEGEALYLHRMASLKKYHGNNIARKIVDWAMLEARKLNRNYLRLDTWANNEGLTAYYQRLGFEWVGKKKLPPESDLMDHYNNLEVNLFQIRLDNN
jgi:N-acetylglutamate synthase and related acetyltransferases